MAKKGLGKGLDSLIPDFYNEDFDSNSTKSLEDLMNEAETNDDIKEDEVPKEESLDEINTDSEEEETPIDESVELSDDDAEVNIFEKIKEENTLLQKNSPRFFTGTIQYCLLFQTETIICSSNILQQLRKPAKI